MTEEPVPYDEATLGERLTRRLLEADDRDVGPLLPGEVLAPNSIKHGSIDASDAEDE